MIKLGARPYWSVEVAAAEFVRQDPLESELRQQMAAALSAVDGADYVWEGDREFWGVIGATSGEALVRGAWHVLDRLAPQVFSNKELQSQASTVLCAYTSGQNGADVYGKTCSGTVRQTWTTSYLNICGGTHVVDGAGSTCPFENGSGLNNLFTGDDIIVIDNPHSSTNWWSGFLNHVYSEPDGTGSGGPGVWVQDGDCAAHCLLINVLGSKGLGYQHYWAACTEGTDQPVLFEDTPASTTGRCKWNTANT